MIKRLFICLLLGLYLTSASGMTLNMHFCGKKLASVQVNAQKLKSCCAGMEGEADHCCKNQELVIKIKDTHAAASLSKLPEAKTLLLFDLPGTAKCTCVWTKKEPIAQPFTNPPPSGISINLKNCVFRI